MVLLKLDGERIIIKNNEALHSTMVLLKRKLKNNIDKLYSLYIPLWSY